MPSTVTICSIYPIRQEHTYPTFIGKGTYVIEAGSPEEPAYVEVEDAYESEHRVGSKNANDQVRRTVTAESIAADLVRTWASNLTDVTDFNNCSPGIRVIEGSTVTQDELAELIRVQRKFAQVKVAEGDRFYQEKQYFRIQKVHHEAVKMLGTSRPEWAQATVGKALVPCPFCSTPIPPHVAVCPNCRMTVNEKAMVDAKRKAGEGVFGSEPPAGEMDEGSTAKILAEAAKKASVAATAQR